MNLKSLSKSIATFAIVGVAAVLAPSVYAGTVNINFDSVALAPGASVSGAPVTNYLAGYGLTLSGMLPGEIAYISNYSPYTYYWAVPSLPNIFTVGGINPIDTFTLNFATPVDNFSFARVGALATSPSGSTRGPWSATAYNASGTSLGSMGEGYIGTYGAIPTQTFALAATGINHISFTGNSYNFAGTNLPIMDNFSFTTPVPEPSTYAMLLAGLGLIGFTARRRKNLAV